MPSTDEERLVVAIEARIRDFEKNMLKAERTASQNFNKMRGTSKSATKQMEEDMLRSTTRMNQALASVSTKIGEFGKAFAGGLIGGIAAGGIAGIVTQVREVAKAVAEVGDQAKIAGLGLETFQEWKFVAEQNRIPVDALTDAMKELSLRADEFVATGGGSAAEAFGRLGYSAEDLKNKLKDPSELMIEIIGRLGQLDRAAQIRIFDELAGGTGGERMVQLINQGEKGIRDTIRTAHELGTVMSSELVAKADELDKRFNAITTSVGSGLKTAIVEAADAMQNFIELYRGFNEEYQKRLKFADAAAQIGAMVNQPAPDPNRPRSTPKTSRLPAETPVLPSQADLSAKYLKDYRDELAQTNRERLIGAEAERILADASSKGLSVSKEQAEALAREKVARDEGEAAAKKAATQREQSAARAEHETKRIKELIAELEEELRIVNLSDAQKRASVSSRQAGAAATDDERKKIIALNEALYQEEEARRKSEEQMMLYRDLTRAGLDDLFSAVEEGKSFWQAMGDVAVNSLKRIADTMLNDVLNSIFTVNKAASGGGGSSFFGSLFSGIFGGSGGTGSGLNFFPSAPSSPIGLFAEGGVADKPSIFAEAGPEAAVPLPDGRRIPVDLGTSAKSINSESSAPSVVQITLSPELEAKILQQAAGQTVQIVTDNNKAREELYQNGSAR